MLNYLIQLSDYFDSNEMHKQANIVDGFIINAQRIDDEDTRIYQDQSIGHGLKTHFKSLIGLNDPNPRDSKIPIGENVLLDLDSHPLGNLIMEYTKNVYMVADKGSSSGSVEVKKINEIVDQGLRYNADTLQAYQSISDNPNPIYPIQFKVLLNNASRLLSQRFKGQSNLDYGAVKDLMDTLYDNYLETYMEDYMGIESTNEDYIGMDQGLKNKPTQPTQEQIDEANRIQNKHENNMYNQEYMLDLEREGNPARHKQRMDLYKQKIRDENPEEWHDILLPED